MKATIFGAGNIGRGLIGVVLAPHYELTFVDANADLIGALNDASSYEVVDTDGASVVVNNARYLLASDADQVVEAVASSDLIATAVGEPILRIVAAPISEGLTRNTHTAVNVLACENVHPNSPLLKRHITELSGDVAAGFPEVIVDRIVSSEVGSLSLLVEPDYEFIVDATQWQGPKPDANIVLADSIDAYEKRKLWLVNGLHASIAYLGAAAGFEYIHEAIADPELLSTVQEAATTMVELLESQYPQFTAGAFAATAASSLTRFADANLVDPIRRVARNPLTKLSQHERILGPALAAEATSKPTEAFATVIAAGLGLNDHEVPGQPELRATVGDDWGTWLAGQNVPPRLIEAIEALQPRGETTMVTETMVIANPAGLHARPASLIVEKVKDLLAKIEIRKGEKQANAASIMSVLSLGAATGDEITVVAEGEDAEEAVAFIRDLMAQTEEAH